MYKVPLNKWSPISLPSPPYQPFLVPFLLSHFRFFSISYPILSCSMASIFSARAITQFIISFSSSVRSGPGLGPGFMVQLPLSTHFLFLNCIYHLLQSKESRYVCHRLCLLTVLDHCVKVHTSGESMGNKEEHCNSNLKERLLCLIVILTQHACSSVCC